MSETATEIGKALRTLRERRGLTALAVAQAAGITNSNLSKYEHGRSGMNADTLHRILRAMGCSFSDLGAELAGGPSTSTTTHSSEQPLAILRAIQALRNTGGSDELINSLLEALGAALESPN